MVSDILGSCTTGTTSGDTSGDSLSEPSERGGAHLELHWEKKLRGGVSVTFKSTWVSPDMTEIKGVFGLVDNISHSFKMQFSGGKAGVARKTRDQALFANFRHFYLHQSESALELADFSIECRRGEVLMAHRLLLAAHSTFFQGFFRRESKDSVSLHFESLPVRACLEFMFTGEVNLGREELGVEVRGCREDPPSQEVLEVANYLGVQVLVEECVQVSRVIGWTVGLVGAVGGRLVRVRARVVGWGSSDHQYVTSLVTQDL